MLRLLRRIFLHNWHLKLASLAIAFLLWSSYSSNPHAEVGYEVPLEFVHVPEGWRLADDAPTTAHVRLRGRSLQLRRLRPADLTITLDLAGLKPGEVHLLSITPQDVKPPMGTHVVGVAPSAVHVRLVPTE